MYMKERTINMMICENCDHGNGGNFKTIVPLTRDIFHFTGAQHAQCLNLNHTHSPVATHFDRAGFCGCSDFTGAGMDIVT